MGRVSTAHSTRSAKGKEGSQLPGRDLAKGGQNLRLTKREDNLVALLESELSYGAIAVRLGMRPNTMKSHMKNIFEKVGVRSRHGVVAWHLRRLLTPQGD